MNDKPTLVLLHGHGVGPHIWDSLQTTLSNEYRILKPDFSNLTNHSTVEAYAEELNGMLVGAQIDRYVLIGHSMGGYVALALAAAHPDRVAALVLFNSTAFADPDTDEQRAKRQAAQEQLQTEGGAAFVQKAVTNMFSMPNQQRKPELVRQTVETYQSLPAEALLAGLAAIRHRPDRTKLLAEATYPVLIVAGRHDTAIPFERTQELKDRLPNARLVILESSGHAGMLEEPERAEAAVKAFLMDNV